MRVRLTTSGCTRAVGRPLIIRPPTAWSDRRLIFFFPAVAALLLPVATLFDLCSIIVSDVLYLSNLMCRSSVSVDANEQLQVASLPSQSGRSIVATSTNHTQLLGPEAMERSGHPYLHQLIQWSQRVDHGLLAAYPSLWRWSLDFGLYRSLYGEAVTPLRDCEYVLEGLRLQQLRSVLLQAFVADIVIHPAGLRAVQDGRMDQAQYKTAMRRLALPAPEAEDSNAAAAAAAAPRGKKGRARFAQSAEGEGEASAAEISASQSSTVSSRLRRSARSQTVGDTKAATAASASSRAASESRSGRSRTRSAAQGEAGEGEEASRRRASSADVGTPVKRKGKLVKIVQRRLKRKERPEGEEETAAAAAAAASVAAPSPAVASVSAPSFSFGNGTGTPSAPSTLATLVLRDLNGEYDLCVELNDPVLGHACFDRAVGSIHAARYDTPEAAPRVPTNTRAHAYTRTGGAKVTATSRGAYYGPRFPH